jgi:mannonate dehydratase
MDWDKGEVMIKIAEVLPANPTPLWRMVKQAGVNYVVAPLPPTVGNEKPWDFMPLLRMKQAFNDGGFEVSVIESRPPLEKAKLGIEGRDAEIDTVCQLLENMGRVGIPVWCYEWMSQFNWTRTSVTTPGRGGAMVTSFDYELIKDAPLTPAGIVTDEQLWASLEYFLKRVVPVAEKAGVKLAMHPDDPPLSPLRGVSRIMSSIDNYQRLLDLVPSPVNGIALCQGNFTLMTDDLPGVIRKFGKQDKIFFAHFRDVKGDVHHYEETFHDEGKTNMLECMKAYKDIGFEGVLRPDHVPTMEGDSNDNPSYSSIGRLFAIGYIKGLREAVYGKQQ